MSSRPSPFRIVVTRSRRRKRSVGASLVDDVLTVTLPSWMSPADEGHWVEVMERRFARRRQTDRIDLTLRARALADRYRLRRPTSIAWAGELRSRWGSCSPRSGEIRVSSRLAAFPSWVLDYVIVHELAHLTVPAHNDDFWQLVHNYPKAERAIGYLIAKSTDSEDPQLSDGADDAVDEPDVEPEVDCGEDLGGDPGVDDDAR